MLFSFFKKDYIVRRFGEEFYRALEAAEELLKKQ